MLLENTTVGRKTLSVRTKRGMITISFESGQVKDVPDDTVTLLKTNSANMMYFNNGIIRKVTKTDKKVVKPDVEEKREIAENPKPDNKKKGKKEKSPKPKNDDDLDL